jgi:hypothetical protein
LPQKLLRIQRHQGHCARPAHKRLEHYDLQSDFIRCRNGEFEGLVDKDAQGKRKRDSIGAACDSEAARGEARQEIVACNLEASAARSSNTIVKTTDGPLKDAFRASASTLLTASIADLVFAHGLSDGLPKAWRFEKVLRLAKLVPSAYVTPGPKLVGGALLNHTYNIYKIEMEGRLKRDYPIFGLTALGDGSLYQVHVLLILVKSHFTCVVLGAQT